MLKKLIGACVGLAMMGMAGMARAAVAAISILSMVVLTAGTAQAVPFLLYGAANIGPDGESTLYQIDTTSGGAVAVGSGIGFERVSAMAFDPSTQTLFGTGERTDGSNTNVLITIDPFTGVGTEVGPTGVEAFSGIFQGSNIFTDISFSSLDGLLYGFSLPGEGLATINIITGAGTQIAFATFNGELGFVGNDGSALAFAPDGTLYHAAGEEPLGNTCSGDPPLGGGGALGCPDPLHIVDPATSLVLSFQALSNLQDTERIPGMDFDPVTGVLFLVVKNGFGDGTTEFLATIDFTNFAVNVIGPTARGMDALAFVNIPEPSTLALFATGLALLAFLGWRRRRVVQVKAA